jgi:hypothetical protein
VWYYRRISHIVIAHLYRRTKQNQFINHVLSLAEQFDLDPEIKALFSLFCRMSLVRGYPAEINT